MSTLSIYSPDYFLIYKYILVLQGAIEEARLVVVYEQLS